jgi:hypothetical protein
MNPFLNKHLTQMPLSFQFQTRFESLVDYYGLDLVKGVILSQDFNPMPEKIKSGGHWLSDDTKNSEVLRMHLSNMINTYGKDIFDANVNFLLGLRDDLFVF